jgi:hypothetical protein
MRQVKHPMPKSSGYHPPALILTRLAAQKDKSIDKNINKTIKDHTQPIG